MGLSSEAIPAGEKYMRVLFGLRRTEMFNAVTEAIVDQDEEQEQEGGVWRQAMADRTHAKAESMQARGMQLPTSSPLEYLQLEAAPPSNGASSSGFASPASALGKAPFISLYLV